MQIEKRNQWMGRVRMFGTLWTKIPILDGVYQFLSENGGMLLTTYDTSVVKASLKIFLKEYRLKNSNRTER